METEDIIELGSSDEEHGPPPPKKMNVRNAMVHIPSNLHGVTIKPVKPNLTQLPKLGKNITITKTTGCATSVPNNRNRPDKTVPKPVTVKKKIIGKKPNQASPAKGKVFNPLSHINKAVVQSVGNSTITRLKHPIVIKKPEFNRPQPLHRLPPSIIIKKTGPAVKPPPNVAVVPKTVPKPILRPVANMRKKRKIEVVPTVELDDEEASTSSVSPQWYVRPEEQSQSTEKDTASTQEEAATSQKDANNKEPEGPKYIEITIEDSPVKPAKTKRTRELSTDKVITIDDSPNKSSVISDDIAGCEGSDNEGNSTKKVPQSKKKLNYLGDLQTIKETHTLEIEIEPMEQMDLMAKDETNVEVNKDKIISLTPEIMEAEEASVEIAQNNQGEISVVQLKPAQAKQNSKVAPKRDVGMNSEFHPIYQSFISLCIQLENSNDMEKIIEKKIKPYYRQVPKAYRESEEFLDMVSSKITAMEAAPDKMYLYIKDVVDELNLQRKYMKQMPVEETKPKDQDSFLCGKENELDPNKQRQIKKLEKTLKKLNRAIHKLEAQEVDFDDEEDSVYLLTEKYKERMVRVHAKFCQLTNTKLPSQPRLVIDPRPGLSAAPAKRLEAFINKKNAVTFPDFHDVLRCVREANEIENLGWNEACIMEEARDLFVRCGRKLQRRRQENEWRLATSRITAGTDPAEQSDDLKKQLEANRRLASTKETEVFDKFCDRQSQMKLEAEEIDDKDAEESPIESEEEENDEDSSLESKQRRKDRLRRLLQEQSKRNTPNRGPETEHGINKEEECGVDTVVNVAVKKSEAFNEEDKIESLSDDSNEIGSDMDELHLLQKLHSDCEIRTVSSSSNSETPIAISDTMDSSSDDERPTKQQETDIISIENSSYSDGSDSEKSNELKKIKKNTVASGELVEESQEMEDSSSIDKDTHLNEATIVNTVLTSTDEEESNLDDNTNSARSNNSSKVSSLKESDKVLSDKDSESAELVKPSDAEDEQSTNSDIIDNPSSTSSGQYEELLKEHNSDPLLKRPDLIPRDPSDELYDSLVIKHYNDPLIKKHLKGSDSSYGDDPENSNSDTQSTIPHETTEEAKKDLIETSVDTEELLDLNSPSSQIVDKLIDKLKQSDGSQSSDEFMIKLNREIGLRPDVMSPVTFALEKEVNLARQTKPWPRFKDECSSLSSAEDDNTADNGQSMPTKKESKNDNLDELEIAESDVTVDTEGKDTDNWSSESTFKACQKIDSAPSKKSNREDTRAGCSRSIKDSSEKMEVAHSETAATEDSKDASISECMKDISEDMDVAHVELKFSGKSKCIDAGSSERTKDASEGMVIAHSEKTLHDYTGACSSGTKAIAEIDTAITEVKDIGTCNVEQPNEIDSDEIINNIVSLGNTNETDQTFKESWNLDVNDIELLNTNDRAQENSSEKVESIVKMLNSNHEPEDRNGDGTDGSELISNGNLNINMDITDLVNSDNMSSKRGADLDDFDQLQSTENADCDDDAVSRTVSSVCLQSTEVSGRSSDAGAQNNLHTNSNVKRIRFCVDHSERVIPLSCFCC